MSARHDLMAMNCCTAEQVSRFRTEVLRIVGELENELSAMKQRAEATEAAKESALELAAFRKEKLEAAEARIKASQEQEPVGYYGSHINGYQFVSRSTAIAYGHEGRVPVYAAPVIPPADVAELQRENAHLELRNTQLRELMREKRIELEKENAELTRKLAEQQSQNNFDAARLRRLVSFCGVAAPDSDEELLQVAGVVIGSCLRVLESKRQAVTEDTVRLNFVVTHDAFIVKRNSGNRSDIFQLWTQDTDEEYHVLHDKSAFFKTERDAIDAAMLSAAPQPSPETDIDQAQRLR